MRLAADTVSRATAARSNGDPRAIAQSASMAGARQFAPGLLGNATGQGAKRAQADASGDM